MTQRLSELARRASSPGLLILAGRASAQAGFFLYSVAPSLVLRDAEFTQLVVGVNVLFLTVGAPAIAFQQHLLRQDRAVDAKADALRKSVLLAVCSAVVGCAIATAFVGFHWSNVVLAVGSIVNVVSMLGASYHALEGRYIRSAALDAASGPAFGIASIVLVVERGSVMAWAAVYVIVWTLSAAVTFVGPLRLALSHDHSLSSFGSIVRSGRTLLVIGVMAMAFNRADYLAMTIVSSDAQASRYALAGRFVGPILIALGSLNNSLYVRQLAVRDQPTELWRMTASASRRIGLLAVAVSPVIVAGIALAGLVSSSLGDRALEIPSIVLVLASIPYAFAIAYAFALTAAGLERVWLRVLTVGTVADLVLVLIVGRYGATATAGAWLATQLGVCWAVRHFSGRTGSLRRTSLTAAR